MSTIRNLSRDDRQALEQWQGYITALMDASPVDLSETPEERQARVRELEADPEAWFRYYFAAYYKAEPAPFHVAATRRLITNTRWYEVRAWARELAKSARSMMEICYLALTGQTKSVLLISYSRDHAVLLLTPFKLFFERSQRLAHDYGNQVGPQWQEDRFKLVSGCTFLAIGAGQSPRGARNEAYRPDFILIDDIDTDEEVRNPERIKTKWKWIEQALLPTLSVSGHYRILLNGNIIARDTCITRAIEQADHADIINIRDEQGRSMWPAKNSEEDIDSFLRMLSTAAIQTEYFNNPITAGEVFTELTWGDCPPLESLRFAICYGDPSPSNNTKSKGASFKAVSLVGCVNGRYYIYKVKVQQTTNDDFLNWYFEIRDYVAGRCPVYYYIENNSLQDPFWEQVLQPLLAHKSRERGLVPIIPDTRAKMDKFARIEATLEPLVRESKLVLNKEERENPHMRRLEEQFLLITPTLPAPADGVDCIEGAVSMTTQKLLTLSNDAIIIGSRTRNPKRY